MSAPNSKPRLTNLGFSKISHTRVKGSYNALGNHIRRRVTGIFKPNGKKGYGPIFGIKKTPFYGGVKNIHYANSGASSDVTTWKRLYGGPRVLFSTKI
jgi:hypothetical protein